MTSSTKLSFYSLNGLEETERQERIADDTSRCNNAKQVAQLIKRNSTPTFSFNGSSKYFRKIEEQERMRLLNDLDLARLSKSHALDVSTLIKNANYPTLNPFYQGTKRNTRKWEETERKRRVSDPDECRARKACAMRASDCVRVGGETIRARFNQRQPLTNSATSKGKLLLSQASAATSLFPTKMTSFFKKAFNTVKTSDTATSIKGFIQNAVHTIVGDSTSLEVIIGWEESERARRMAEDSTGSAIGNAKRLAQIMSIAKFPKLIGSKGFNSYTRSMEEWERSRRLANRMEGQNNRMVAFEVSRMVEQLGWPLISSAKNRTNDASLFEDERSRRLSDREGAMIARENARKVSCLVIAVLPKNKSKSWSYTAQLEETERKYRIKYGGEYAVHNAHRQAQVIASIGEPFVFSTASKDIPAEKLTKPIISEERRARQMQRDIMGQKMEQLMDIKQMQRMAKEPIVEEGQFSSDTKLMEEKERQLRLKNKEQQRQALVNANSIARLIKQKSPHKESAKKPTQQKADKPLVEAAKIGSVPSTSLPAN